ncbi:MAG TPA: glycosyltransferase family 39 protein [Kineosporiaceae bacterium]|nr:glycosyltransferase family 39 protein [Kineosporiaceae bacterium]
MSDSSAGEQEPSGDSPTTARDSAGPVRLTTRDRFPIMAMIVLIMACGTMLGIEFKVLSPIDELPHFDYVARLVDSHRIPGRNEGLSLSGERTLACYGSREGTPPDLPCDAPRSVYRRWHSPPNTAGGYPPVFYFPVAAVAAATKGPAGNLFLGARLAATLWLALGAVAGYLLSRTAGAGRVTAFGVAVGAALSPIMLFQGATVNPDAASMLCGAGAVLAWLRWRNRTGWWPWLGLSVVLGATTLVKANLLPIPVAIAAAELTLAAYAAGPRMLLSWRTWTPVTSTGRTLWASGAGAAIGGLWSVVFLVVLPPAQDITLPAIYGNQPWKWHDALISLLSTYNPLSAGGSFLKVLNGAPLTVLTAVLGVLALSGAALGALLGRDRDRVPPQVTGDGVVVEPARAISVAALWSLLLAAPVTYAEVAATGHFFVYPARYSLWTVPIGLAAAVGLTGRRGAQLIGAIGLLIAAWTTVKLIGGLPL